VERDATNTKHVSSHVSASFPIHHLHCPFHATGPGKCVQVRASKGGQLAGEEAVKMPSLLPEMNMAVGRMGDLSLHIADTI